MKNRIALSLMLLCGLLAGSNGQTEAVKNMFNKKNLKKAEQKTGEITRAASQKANSLVPAQNGIPLIGDLSDVDEIALGRETAGRMLAAYPLVAGSDSVQRYVNLIGVFVAGQSPRAALPWTFGVIASDDINAFAMPGGYIVITRGLYKNFTSEAELACVLAHEIAHVNLRHQVRLMQKELLIAKGSDFLAGKTRQAALKELAGFGAVIAARSLDREAEYDSDRTGMEYAARAGYDPYCYLELLDRLSATGTPDRMSLLYKTHPQPRERVDALGKAVEERWISVQGVVPVRWVGLQ